MDRLSELREYVKNMEAAPTLETMQRRTLADKGIEGPTGAHVIEEIHTPFNLAYVTFTTGTSAFQNIVGVTGGELEARERASRKALSLAKIAPGSHILFTYPPLVSVFSKQALESLGVTWSFLKSSSRDALVLELCENHPDAVVGESSFIRSALEDAQKMGIQDLIAPGTALLCAGTPLDLELLRSAEKLAWHVHDLYGCQEFGWLTLDGEELREDITLLPSGEYCDLLVGGLPTGDRFPVSSAVHICGGGRIITYKRVRSGDIEPVVVETTVSSKETLERAVRSMLRIKAKIVRVSPEVVTGAAQNVLEVNGNLISGAKTQMFDTLLAAQAEYQAQSKTDPAWIKRR